MRHHIQIYRHGWGARDAGMEPQVESPFMVFIFGKKF